MCASKLFAIFLVLVITSESQECQSTLWMNFVKIVTSKSKASCQCLIFVCRRRNDRPWQKRWIVFIAEELKYYKTKGVKVWPSFHYDGHVTIPAGERSTELYYSQRNDRCQESEWCELTLSLSSLLIHSVVVHFCSLISLIDLISSSSTECFSSMQNQKVQLIYTSYSSLTFLLLQRNVNSGSVYCMLPLEDTMLAQCVAAYCTCSLSLSFSSPQKMPLLNKEAPCTILTSRESLWNKGTLYWLASKTGN